MLKKHAQIFAALFSASDMFVVSVAWLLSYVIRFSLGVIPVEKGIPPFSDYLKATLFVWVIWFFVFRQFGLYKAMRGSSRINEMWQVIRANTFSVILLLAMVYLFQEKNIQYSRLVFLIFWGLSALFTLLSRSVVRGFLRVLRRRGYNLRYALIVGAGSVAKKVARSMIANPEFGIDLLGCLAKDKKELQESRGGVVLNHPTNNGAERKDVVYAEDRYSNLAHFYEPNKYQEPIPVIGIYQDIPIILSQGRVDQIIISLPHSDHELLKEVISLIGDAMVDVKIVPDVHEFIQLGSDVEEFDGLPVISLAATPLVGVNRIFKRAFDFFIGSFILVILSPIMLLISLLVYFTSGRPIFYKQERVGLDGKKFSIFKFRTMSLNAEDSGAKFAVKNDPRVTKLGSLLRKLNLDELPQLVNVVRGQMSLVGPRPERPVFIEQFRSRIPKYMLRHKVQASMTGWAQVHGWRGNTSIEKRIEHDLFYIENWSLFLDIRILFLTIFRSFTDRNAY